MLELDDGTFIAECTAITEYLDALDGTPTLTGRTAHEKGLIHLMSKRAELELLDAISAYFQHGTPGLGPDVEFYQNADWGLHQRDRAERGVRYFDAVLKKQPFVAGEARPAFPLSPVRLCPGDILTTVFGPTFGALECGAMHDMPTTHGTSHWPRP